MTTYKDDLAEKNKWSKLHELVDAAALMYEKEKRADMEKSKTVEEEKSKRLFDDEHVDTKTTSSVKKSNPQNLNEVSVSLSHLDINTTPQNPSPLLVDNNMVESEKQIVN